MTWESVLKSPIPTRLKRFCNSAKTIYGYGWKNILEDILQKEVLLANVRVDPYIHEATERMFDIENIKIGRMMKQDRENRLYDVIYLPNPKKVSRWQCNEFIKLLVTICENKEKYTLNKITEKIGKEIVTLPMHPNLTENNLDKIIIKNIINSNSKYRKKPIIYKLFPTKWNKN